MKAFPCSVEQRENDRAGMNLRDYFAAHALSGFIVSSSVNGAEWIAAAAYKVADAMLAERNNNKE